jgi:hypothetical protein
VYKGEEGMSTDRYIPDERDHAHGTRTFGTEQQVDLVDPLHQPGGPPG